MARRSGAEDELYAAYLSQGEMNVVYKKLQDQAAIRGSPYPPPPQFYTTNTGMTCRRHFCAVCGSQASANRCHGPTAVLVDGQQQRSMEWITGITLPDALSRARTAKLMQDGFR
ncbi:unnamed protein product [Echinostoma caproni]|uniref:Mcm10 domain-containing protein n=1 Tax=Echinostoma caproni TaxID=27848 RepID=A0A183AJ25_9TREM|nr:unnamed protein product [Echinostoma caproni]